MAVSFIGGGKRRTWRKPQTWQTLWISNLINIPETTYRSLLQSFVPNGRVFWGEAYKVMEKSHIWPLARSLYNHIRDKFDINKQMSPQISNCKWYKNALLPNNGFNVLTAIWIHFKTKVGFFQNQSNCIKKYLTLNLIFNRLTQNLVRFF